MLANRRVSSFTKENSDLHNGQTLFEFLKRKKKFALNQSIAAQKNKSYSKGHDYSENKRIDEQTPLIQTKRQRPYQHSNQKINLDNTSNTPRRVRFAENDQKKANKSFIQMISPLNRKNLQRSVTPQPISNLKPSILKNPKENYSRRNINQKLNLMKQTLQTLIQTGKDVKQKAHSLFIEMKPILRFVENNAENDLLKKAESTKGKLRTFEMQFKKFDVQDSSQIIQSFHRALSQHINSVQADLRCQFEKKFIQSTIKLKNDKQVKNQQLQSQNSNLMKNIQLLQRRLEKAQKAKIEMAQNNESQQQFISNQFNSKIESYQNKIKSLQDEISSLQTTIKQYSQRQIDLQKKLKTTQYLKQQSQKKFREEADSIKSKKEEFLLNEIMMLKTEFKRDMTQITDLYSVKQSDYLKTIKQLQEQISEIIHKRKCDRGLQDKFLEQISAHKIQVSKFKKQNQCLITDMHRMNQELYQHWLALKDIKTLSCRLDIFPKFQRIYEDLGYNEFLFA